MLKEMRRQNREQQRRYRAKQKAKKNPKTTTKHRKPVHPTKEMNEKIKVIQKENEKRKAVIRTLRWRLIIKLQKDNTDK